VISNTIIQNRVKIEAFILVGGRSSRLGSDKAFVKLGGKTLMRRSVDVVRQAFPESPITVVAGNSTQFAIQAITADVPFIFDLHEDRGPIGGLHAALAHTRSEWIFVLACDYPFVSPEFLRLLAQYVSPGFGAVVPEQADGRLQPLCAIYNVEAARPLVEEIIARPRVSPPMHEVVERLDARIVKFDEYAHLSSSEELFCNINTADDVEQATKIDSGRSVAE
jgi:molybdopterin-guanine dinucleotide biosynthesis protein A